MVQRPAGPVDGVPAVELGPNEPLVAEQIERAVGRPGGGWGVRRRVELVSRLGMR